MKRSCFIALIAIAVFGPIAQAGWIEDRADGTPVIHLTLFKVPDPSRTDTFNRAEAAGVREFVRRFPEIFRARCERYKADPAKYGRHAWDKVQIELHQASGINVEGVESDLLAIAGGVAPDVLYVNFRKSDTYIQQGFLYPLDKPEDGYLASMTPAELEQRVHSKIWPVIKRKGPTGDTHVWALPYGGAFGQIVLYRKDLFDEAGLKYPQNNWTWDDLYSACRRLTNPARGTYGIYFGLGSQDDAYYWMPFLWSVGGDALIHDEKTDRWQAVFDSREAAISLDFYNRLCTEVWTDSKGQRRRGYAFRANVPGEKWERGQIGMMFSNIGEKVFATINPEITGMVAVPIGPTGQRGGELNSLMMAVFAGISDPVIRDAAWEYIRFYDSDEALRVKTRVMVEGGLGQFINPAYLKAFGYPELIRLAPKGWAETFQIAVESGKPEPYGRNSNIAYNIMGEPLERAEQMSLAGQLPQDREARLQVLQNLLHGAVEKANEKMIGMVPPADRSKRRVAAVVVLLVIIAVFAFSLRGVGRALSSARQQSAEPSTMRWSKHAWAAAILLPAVLTILVWQYIPLCLGSLMAFQDFKIMGGSRWVWLDNFGDVLWDGDWWRSLWNSFRFSFLVIVLTFLPPLGLAILLQEVPRGRLFFRVVYYLPAALAGLVTILLWKQFYDPSEHGVLNLILLRIPAIGFIALGLILLLICGAFAQRLFLHQSRVAGAIAIAAGLALLYTCISLAAPIFSIPDLSLGQKLIATLPQPRRWLSDPDTAMLCCVLPFIWSGVGPGSLIYLAALKTVPDDFYEAGDIDGATLVDKILFIVVPALKPLLIINFVGIFIGSWHNSANILALTGGSANTQVADLNIFYSAFMYLRFGPATAMAWMLGVLLIGFTVQQLWTLSRMEFKTAPNRQGVG